MQVLDIGLPEEVEQAIDKGGAVKAVGDLRKLTQYETAESIPTAAANPSGTAGAGIGMGMGFSMAGQMGQAMGGMGAQTPPPLPGYFIAKDGKQAGPFTNEVLQQKIAAGEFTRETLVWKAGMDQWAPAGQTADLAELFVNVPPPIPGK